MVVNIDIAEFINAVKVYAGITIPAQFTPQPTIWLKHKELFVPWHPYN